MNKDTKILLMALVIIIVGFVSFNFVEYQDSCLVSDGKYFDMATNKCLDIDPCDGERWYYHLENQYCGCIEYPEYCNKTDECECKPKEPVDEFDCVPGRYCQFTKDCDIWLCNKQGCNKFKDIDCWMER